MEAVEAEARLFVQLMKQTGCPSTADLGGSVECRSFDPVFGVIKTAPAAAVFGLPGVDEIGAGTDLFHAACHKSGRPANSPVKMVVEVPSVIFSMLSVKFDSVVVQHAVLRFQVDAAVAAL